MRMKPHIVKRDGRFTVAVSINDGIYTDTVHLWNSAWHWCYMHNAKATAKRRFIEGWIQTTGRATRKGCK